jgi:hypothetical protein
MARVRFRTDHRLWRLAAGGLFIALGFIDPVAGVAKGDYSLWAYVARLATSHRNTWDIVVPILFRSVLLALVAAPLGWLVQALVVIARGGVEGAAVGRGAVPAGPRGR